MGGPELQGNQYVQTDSASMMPDLGTGSSSSEATVKDGIAHSFSATVGTTSESMEQIGDTSAKSLSEAHLPKASETIGADHSESIGKSRSVSFHKNGQIVKKPSALDNPETRKSLIGQMGPVPKPLDDKKIRKKVISGQGPLPPTLKRVQSTSGLKRPEKPLPQEPTRGQSTSESERADGSLPPTLKRVQTTSSLKRPEKPLPQAPTRGQSSAAILQRATSEGPGGSVKKAQQTRASSLSRTSSTKKVSRTAVDSSNPQNLATFDLGTALKKIGSYEQFDPPPVDLNEQGKIVYRTSGTQGEGIEVTYDNEEGGFVDANKDKVDVPTDSKGNPILFNKDGTQIPCDKTGKPDPQGFPKVRPPLSDTAKAKLYKGCPETSSQDKRQRFLQRLQSHLRDVPPASPNEDGSKPVTSLLDFFGGDKELLAIYKEAVAEEKNSREFRDAVMAEASEKQDTNPCPGQKMVMYVGGPSASGKSFTRGAFVDKVREMKTDGAQEAAVDEKGEPLQEDDSYVVSVDGGIDRAVCQMRGMLLQSALAKGYAGLEDLHEHTDTSVKGNLKNAAMAEGNNMHVVIPATFISGFQKFVGMFRDLASKRNTFQVFAEVRADHTSHGSDSEADESFRQTIRYNGDSRAYLLEGEPDFQMRADPKTGIGGIRMNNRSIPCESKVYQPKYFDLGVMFSNRAKDVFRLVASKKRSLILSNNSDNMHVDAQGRQTTTKPAVKHISRREVEIWRRLDPNNPPSRTGILVYVRRLGHSEERTQELTDMILEGSKEGKFEALKEFQKFLNKNNARAKLKVTSSRI